MFARIRSPHLRVLLISAGLLSVSVFAARPARSQDSQVSEQERVTAEKFLEVLKRRPRPGTALDRVYGFHVRNGSLDTFMDSLEVAEESPEDGRRLMILGLLQSQRGNQALAAGSLAKAERLLPEDAACSYFLGRALLAIGQTDQAAAAFERSILRQPPRSEALPIFTELGRIYSRAGLSDRALEVWTKLESLFPGDARVGGQIASTLADDGNVEEALRRFESLSQTATNDDDKISFAVQAAEMRRRLGQTEQCIAALETILARLRPGSWLYSDVRNRIEDSFLKSGDYDALAEYYKQKLAGSGDDVAMQVRLGQILVSARRLDEAANTLTQAVARAPNDPDVRLALVDVLVAKGDRTEAAKHFSLLAEADPQNPDYLIRWGQVLLEDDKQPLEDRRQAAAEIWQRLAETRSDDAVTLAQIADRMRGIDRKEDAIALYQKAIEVDRNSPQYREYLGEYFYRLGRNDEAIKVWDSIAQEDRRNRDSLVRLAEVFGTFEQDARSLEAWRQAAELDLSFPQELRFSQKLRDAERYDEAITRLQRAETIAETPEEHEQLLKDRIATYQQAGTLDEQIARLESEEATAKNFRTLAMMHAAAGQLTEAEQAIRKAINQTPDDPNVLLVAAELAERQNRFSDAAETFRKLSRIDVRFQTNYLQRVADLQMRLGQVDQAMDTCDALIDANPASPESYQFLARMAFRAGRDDRAFAAIRRAMTVAPRDNTPRRMLAGAFADRYRTEEAIELYWQAMRYETEVENRISLVKHLAPLYDRKAEIDELIRRIQEMSHEDVDARTIQLMIAATYEAVQDFGAARQAIERILVGQPRDISLLETMVRLSDAADDVVTAAEFQQRIVSISDTPQNRFRLVQLQLDAGMIDIREALSERLSFGSNPSQLAGMIQSAIRRGERSTAIAICEAACEQDPSLWDIKLTLAQLLLHENGSVNTSDGAPETYPKPHQRAIELAAEIRRLNLPLDTLPPTAVTTSRTSNSLTNNQATSPARWGSSGYTLARAYRIGRYASSSYSSSSMNDVTAEPSSFGHARVLATAVEMVAIAKRFANDEIHTRIQALIDQTVSLPAVKTIDDATVIGEYRALESIKNYFLPASPPHGLTEDQRKLSEDLNWRLAELDPEAGASSLRSMLMTKVRAAANQRAKDPDDADTEANNSRLNLSQRQVQLVTELYEQAMADSNASSGNQPKVSWSMLSDYRMILSSHFEQIGDSAAAQKYALQSPAANASLSELIAAISYHLTLGHIDQADSLVDRLMPSVHGDTSGASNPSSSISGTAGHLVNAGSHANEFVDRHRLRLMDAVLAQAINNPLRVSGTSAGLSDGTLQTYVRSSSNSYYSLQIQAPLSTELLNQQVVNEFSSLLPPRNDPGQPRSLNLSDAIIEHLDQPLDGATTQEQKTRSVLAAYACWWMKRPQECYQRINQLCQQFPNDVNLRIEQARLASELSQPRVALTALDSFDPLDSGMLVRKEMAALNLASQIGDVERAKLAAERLFGLQMDTKTQLALADQLQRLGMHDKSAAILRRLKGGRARDERTELQIAQAFLSGGDQETAAEVAYSVMRRLNSGRGTSSNASSYRQQAVSILRKANRLDPLIQQAQRRVESSPASVRAQIELAELYASAGKKTDADLLWAEIAKTKPNDPQQLITRANALVKARQYEESIDLFLDAFEKNPQLIDRHVYEMTRAVEQSGKYDLMFTRLTRLDPESIQPYRFSTLINVGRRKPYTDSKRTFIAHALKNSQVKRDFYRYISGIPEGERKKIPEIRQAMIDVICDDDVFAATSSTWHVTSRSSGGTANGPLNDLLTLLRNDPDARERFHTAANNARNDAAFAPTVQFFSALLDVGDESKRDAAIESIRALFKPETVDQEPNESAAILISGGLLWQGGQVLEPIAGIKDKTPLLVSIYDAAARDPNVSRTDMRFSVGARLVNALANDGQRARARGYLLEAYARTDHSADDQYNPGYGDYQDIQSYQSIAEKLDEIGFPIDALQIYQRLIASPARFERAKRWGGTPTVDDAKKATQELAKKISSASAAEYLNLISESIDQQQHGLAIPLLEQPLESIIDSRAPSGIELAIETASLSADGRDALTAFAESLKTHAAQHPNDWSIPAVQILVAIKIQPDDLESLAETLKQRLPSEESVRKASETPNTASLRPLSGLFVVASAASQSDVPSAAPIANGLSQYLAIVANAIGDPTLELAVATLDGDDGDSLNQFLDQIETSSRAASVITHAQSEACLNIATLAAKRGQVSLSARALTLALQNGPPLKPFGGGTDAFAINQNQISQPMETDDGIDGLTTRLLDIVDLYSDATAQKLGGREPVSSSTARQEDVATETWKTLDQALRLIVLPPGHSAEVFPYAKRIASRREYDNYSSNDDLSPQSVSIAMARVAALAKTSDTLLDSIAARLTSAVDPPTVAGILVDVALASGSEAALSDALDQFATTLDTSLPGATVPETKPEELSTITQDIQQESFQKSDVIDLVVRTLAPVSADTNVNSDDRRKVMQLLERTLRLIESDSYSASRHQEIARRIRDKVLANAATTGDPKPLENVLKQQLDAIKTMIFGGH